MKRPIRVFQVATGNVGTEMIGRILGHSDLELVGLHCYTPEKVGRDAGEIVGLPAIGIPATGTIANSLRPHPMWSPSMASFQTSTYTNASWNRASTL